MFLPDLDKLNARRREIATYYSSKTFHPNIITPEKRNEEYVAHLYVIRSAKRDELRKYLHDKNITTDIHYPIPDYRQPIFTNRFKLISLENTELLSKEILTLPCYPEMTDSQVKQIVTAINAWRP